MRSLVNAECVNNTCNLSIMTEHVSIRLRNLRQRAGLSMGDLAVKSGFKGQSSIQRYEDDTLYKKTFLPTELAAKFANAMEGLGTPPITRQEVMALSLTTEVLEQAKSIILDTSSPKSHSTTIPELDLKAGAGGGGLATLLVRDNGHGITITEEGRKEGGWDLPDHYLSELGIQPNKAHIMEVKGDSMYPTLQSGERIMVDTSDRRPSPPGLFVVVDEWGGVMVKRIHPIAGAEEPMLRVISDNENHPEEDWPWMNHTIVGRVIWAARPM